MEERIIDFYKRGLYGSNYNVKNKNDINMIANCCFTNAWKDMARTYPISNQEERIELKANILKDLTTQIKSKKYTPREIINKYTNVQNLTLGQSQKVVNMFFKYLYTFSDLEFIKPEYFSDCDCPIDSIIINRIKEKQSQYKDIILLQDRVKYKNKIYAWSKIDNYDCYLQLQELIENLSPTTKLDFDFDEWN
ncbi:MAG: hypothetical protein E7351_01625 [Clostridiales bacterium]|nr:hypothetical protein [Clostridiales bacterium]